MALLCCGSSNPPDEPITRVSPGRQSRSTQHPIAETGDASRTDCEKLLGLLGLRRNAPRPQGPSLITRGQGHLVAAARQRGRVPVSHIPAAELRVIPGVYGHFAGGGAISEDTAFIDDFLNELLGS